jgi:hypothetical protein
MIGRRRLILGACAVVLPRISLAAPSPIPPGDALAFRIVRNGSEIGTHVLNFAREGDRLTVQIKVDLSLGIGPVKLFRYSHRAIEIREADRLISVESETDDDGKIYKMAARRTDAGLIVEGSRASRYTAPDDARAATHWDRRMLDGPIINTQYGNLMRPMIRQVGEDRVPTSSGDEIEAKHFSLSGDVMLDTWYDETPSWAALRFQAADKSEVRYERL